MLSERMEQALNGQVNAELQSAYQYLAQSAYFESIDLKGFAHWMRIQYQEERAHALKIYQFIIDREGRVRLMPLAEPVGEWESPTRAFEAALESERDNSRRIHEICDLAMGQTDHATLAFMQWFVNEQVEEEAVAYDLLQRLKLVADSNAGLFMLDQELSQRTPAPESADMPVA